MFVLFFKQHRETVNSNFGIDKGGGIALFLAKTLLS